MKRCPFCAEEIQDAAVKCKHCGEMLTPRAGAEDNLDRQVTISSMRPSRTGPNVAPPGEDASVRYDTLDSAVTRERGPTVLGGQYRILKKLGKGGMGVVYLAEDMEMDDRLVAIKVLPPELSDNERAVENLRREARIAIDLTHRNIIRLYGFHSDGDMKFLVMEYVDGQNLEQKLARSKDGKLRLEEMLPIIEKVAVALDHAHSQRPRVIHRDLKPSNIMLGKDGVVKLLDFGIAREMKDSFASTSGSLKVAGTPPYMSPEQVRGKAPSPAMDIYSLGVVCYECLRGRPPFHTGPLEYQILYEQPQPLDGVPEHVNQAILSALAKEVSKRPNRASDLVGLLSGRGPCGAQESGRTVHLPSTVRGRPALGEAWTVPDLSMTLVYVEAGSFQMGSDDSEVTNDERPVHAVAITRGYWMGKHEVTNTQYQSFVRQSGYDGSGEADDDYLRHYWDGGQGASTGDNHPIVCVSWNNAVAFCRWLTERERQAGRLPEGHVYRLPTEAEWEYAARGGAKSRGYKYAASNNLDEVAWYASNSGGETHPVGQKKANELGLCDMSGNVWEWCHDWYAEDYYGRSGASDPAGPASGRARVLRGGSWNRDPRYCRVADRGGNSPRHTGSHHGFRVVVSSGPLD